jgi:HK97 family phage prohead protease
MKTKLRLERLKAVLPIETREALETEGFFNDAEAYVKRTAVIAEVKALKEGERAVERYISTWDVDRDREVLDPAGAILDQFKLAPQVLWAHDYSLPPIAKAEWVRVDDKGLRSKTVYAETERAEEVWQLIKGGFLATASVGFIPVKRVWKGDAEWGATVAKYNTKWSTDLEKAGAEIITTKWLLLEYSDVPVPANPNALVTAIAKGLKLSDDLIEELDLPEAEAEPPAEPEIKAVEQEAPAAEPEPEPEVEDVKTAGLITRYTPPDPAPEVEPALGPITRPIQRVKTAPLGIIKLISRAPEHQVLVQQIAEDTLAQLRGKV